MKAQRLKHIVDENMRECEMEWVFVKGWLTFMNHALYPNRFAHSQVKWPKCPYVT